MSRFQFVADHRDTFEVKRLLAIGSVVDETPCVRRSQLVQSSPTTLRIRLDIEPEVNPNPVWDGVRSKVATYLAAQNLPDVEIVRGEEQPQQATGCVKYRQVIAHPRP